MFDTVQEPRLRILVRNVDIVKLIKIQRIRWFEHIYDGWKEKFEKQH